MSRLSKILSDFFSFGVKSNHKPVRRHIRDVKPNEYIAVEWSRIVGRIGKVRCLNNDPASKRILIEVNWGNMPKERIVVDYKNEMFDNFHLLNESVKYEERDEEEDDFDLVTLQKKMNEAIEEEEYERAEEYQRKINELIKK